MENKNRVKLGREVITVFRDNPSWVNPARNVSPLSIANFIVNTICEDYDIVRKPENKVPDKPTRSPNPTVRHFKSKEAMLEFTERRISPTDILTPDIILRPTPNCSICEWKRDNSFKDLFGIERKNHACSAQADWELSEVYNSPECKRLFLARDLPTCEPPAEKKLNDFEMAEKVLNSLATGGSIMFTDSRKIKLTQEEMVELARTRNTSLGEIIELFKRKP